MKELNILALRENLPQVTEFVDGQLVNAGCPENVRTQVCLAVEEIFVNIASYSYEPSVGSVWIKLEVSDRSKVVIISFTDTGIPYDPLSRPDADTKMPPKERKKGGWGIFMIKQFMDDMRYEYRDGQNILTIIKSWNAVK